MRKRTHSHDYSTTRSSAAVVFCLLLNPLAVILQCASRRARAISRLQAFRKSANPPHVPVYADVCHYYCESHNGMLFTNQRLWTVY